ncbi:hypothetical protein tinsulaeT_24640 [Thalassotalea insulae]|uniref:Uncharacterized protein n=1 Tax=Thalassotalea insulae TaxID=2056778 RepID=A0ABQ6GTZ2_9GAMM|nr:hypothetical protein tinsulaeT_24640 [Thalassotalea insulae]
MYMTARIHEVERSRMPEPMMYGELFLTKLDTYISVGNSVGMDV